MFRVQFSCSIRSIQPSGMRNFAVALAVVVAATLATASDLYEGRAVAHAHRGGDRNVNLQPRQADQCRIAANYGLKTTAAGVMASMKASSAGSCCRKCETHAGCAAATFDRAASVCHLRAALPKREHIAPSPATDLILTLRTPLPKVAAAALDSNSAVALAPAAAQNLCDGAVCVGGEVCCGGLVCYVRGIQQCCLSPTFAICGAGYVCVPSEGGCIRGTPTPANLTCGSVICTRGLALLWQRQQRPVLRQRDELLLCF